MDIVVLDGGFTNPGDLSWAGLERFGRVTVYADTAPEEAAGRIGGAWAVIDNRVPITAQVLAACPKLKYIGLTSTGYEYIDLAAARAAGVTVCNAPAYSTASVAQHAMALLLEITNHVAAYSAEVRGGRWPEERYAYPLSELGGKTFGAIGFGRIGRAAGELARAFGMRVLACGARPCPEGSAIAEYMGQAQLLAESDVVSLHCPLTPENRGLINAETLAAMKPGAILLNTARGAVVAEQALADALNEGQLAAAGLDVLDGEPPAPESPLLAAKNCFITPHVGWSAKEARRRLLELVAANMAAFLAGTPQNQVEAK